MHNYVCKKHVERIPANVISGRVLLCTHCVPALCSIFPIATFRRVILNLIQLRHLSGIATLVHALVVIVSAIALLTSLDNFISAKRSCK